jgi:predicted transcriptional regulator
MRLEVFKFFGLGAVLAGLFARLRGDSLLSHFARGRLYQSIEEHPGVHFSELLRLTKLSNGAGIHHLRVLVKAGYIRVVREGTRTCFYTTERAVSDDHYGLVGCDGEVLREVQRTPGLSVVDIAARVERSPSATSRSVARLDKLGYLHRERVGRKAAVYPRLKSVGLEGAASNRA